jgi:hypothetical protein
MISIVLALFGAHRVFMTYKQDEMAKPTQMGQHSPICALWALRCRAWWCVHLSKVSHMQRQLPMQHEACKYHYQAVKGRSLRWPHEQRFRHIWHLCLEPCCQIVSLLSTDADTSLVFALVSVLPCTGKLAVAKKWTASTALCYAAGKCSWKMHCTCIMKHCTRGSVLAWQSILQFSPFPYWNAAWISATDMSCHGWGMHHLTQHML